METGLAFLIGALSAASIYMMLRRNLVRLIIGLILLSNSVNLLIFTAGRLTPANPPLIPPGADTPVTPFANPLPQALILTAIVISFGLLAFTLVLVYRAYQELGTMDADDLRTASPAAADIGAAAVPPRPPRREVIRT